uniref:Uncharacterized protein n=1 Tax=Arundo donax TaxID=35708 RepID=A0A0A8ZEC4_ARUDO
MWARKDSSSSWRGCLATGPGAPRRAGAGAPRPLWCTKKKTRRHPLL